MTENGHELIQPIEVQLPPGMQWQPVMREETQDLLGQLKLSDEGRDVVKSEAVHILGRVPPLEKMTEASTGLVMGYVQSGKTLSFTVVTALARDNGFPLVILITGISKPLFE